MSDQDDTKTMRGLRIRLEGGTLSDIEHSSIEYMAFDITKVLVKNSKLGRKIAVQAMLELVFAAIAFDSTTKEEFFKGVYNLAKDYIFPQADKIGELLVKRRLDQINNPEKIQEIIEDYEKLDKQSPTVIVGDIGQVLDQLEKYVNETLADDCPCPKCVARREKENKERGTAINPNPNTKH